MADAPATTTAKEPAPLEKIALLTGVIRRITVFLKSGTESAPAAAPAPTDEAKSFQVSEGCLVREADMPDEAASAGADVKPDALNTALNKLSMAIDEMVGSLVTIADNAVKAGKAAKPERSAGPFATPTDRLNAVLGITRRD